MLDAAQLTSDLVALFTFEYSDDAGTPLFSQSAGLTSTADAAAAWADALIKYCSGATAGGSPLSPVEQITSRQASLRDTLTASFALPTLLTDLIDAIGDLFQVPPATFGTFVTTDTTTPRAPAITSLMSMTPTADNIAAATTFAGVIDTMVKAFTATQPGSPPVVVTLL